MKSPEEPPIIDEDSEAQATKSGSDLKYLLWGLFLAVLVFIPPLLVNIHLGDRNQETPQPSFLMEGSKFEGWAPRPEPPVVVAHKPHPIEGCIDSVTWTNDSMAAFWQDGKSQLAAVHFR